MTSKVSPNEQSKILLPIVRAAIAQALGLHQTADESAPWLNETGACFVTLTQHGQLRGCIGTLEPHRSLLADIKAMRFPPLCAIRVSCHCPRKSSTLRT